MKNLLVILIIILISFVSCKKEDPPLSLDSKIERIAKSHIIFGRTPGIAIGIYHDGVITQYFYGTRNLSTGQTIDEFTMFEICSITKTFTALLFADFVIKNEIPLNDTIDDYFPEDFNIPNKDGKYVQFLHLLNHTSGIPREPDLPNLQAFAVFNENDLKNYLSTLQLTTTPGSNYEYSNLGMGLIGYLLERISGKTYSELLQERIFTPLGMTQTVCSETDFITDNNAQGYFGSNETDMYIWSPVFAAAGTIKSNLHDMMIYLIENIEYENSILKEPLILTKQRTFSVNENLYLGLGWHLTIDGKGDEIYWHNGGTKGFSSFIAYNNSTKDGVVVLINSYCTGEQNNIGIEILNLLKEY
ncbi:MAG TPA: serine hydrolase domain-containing protein [Bacteroidales bacterium]|nr:serine hydrolase domain-containing protein [Bacteroidales bacterium]